MAQVTFADLEAGYRENVAKLSELSYRADWSSNAKELPVEFLESQEKVHQTLTRLQNQLPEGGAKEFCNAIVNSFSKAEIQKSANRKNMDPFGQFLNTEKGIWIRSFMDHPGELPSELNRRVPPDTSVSVSTFVIPPDFEYLGIHNFDSRNQHSHFSVLSYQESKKTVPHFQLPIPLPKTDPKLCEMASCYTDDLFPSNPSRGRMSAKIEVQIEGQIAVVKIMDLFHFTPLADDQWIEGASIYAELEMDKGFLPKIIKTSRVAWYQGKLLNRLADDYWSSEVQFENERLETGIFVPRSIAVSNNAMVFSDATAIRYVNEYETNQAFMLGSSVNEIGKVLQAGGKEIKVKWQIVDPNAYELHFSMDEPEGVQSFYDSRNGKVKINSSLDKSLDLDLDAYRENGNPSVDSFVSSTPPNKLTWILWGLLAMLSALGLWWARR